MLLLVRGAPSAEAERAYLVGKMGKFTMRLYQYRVRGPDAREVPRACRLSRQVAYREPEPAHLGPIVDLYRGGRGGLVVSDARYPCGTIEGEKK